MKTLKALSALLTYPSPELVGALPEIRSVLTTEALLPATELGAVDRLIDHIGTTDIYDLQEAYGLLFDRTRQLSLHLFEHVHGESRDRGQAMVDLLKVYEDGGYTPTERELPDYVPLFLEYAATRERDEALELISQPAHVFAALRERLAKRGSPYEAVFAALVKIAKAKPDAEALAALRAEPEHEPDDLEALDAAWAEEEVKFGPGAASDCGTEGLAAKLRQARRPAPGMDVPPMPGPRTEFTHSTPRPRA